MLSFQLTASSQIVTTVAGDGSLSYTGNGGAATLAGIGNMNEITIDISGNYYFTEYNNTIRKVSSSGIISTIAGIGLAGFSGDSGLATNAQINYSKAVAIDKFGNVFISDNSNHRIRKINITTGVITTIAGNGTAGFSGDGYPAIFASLNYPCGICFDTLGNLYIADHLNNRIRKIDTLGIITTVVGTGVQGYNGDGGLADTAQIVLPYGIHCDKLNNLYICTGYKVRKVDALSHIITTFAGNGNSGFSGDGGHADTATLLYIVAVTSDTWRNVYITDEHRIRKVDTNGIISTVVGNGIGAYNGDGGLADTTEIWTALGVAVDICNNLYISDNGNNRIRKVWFNIDSTFTASIAISPNDTVSIGTTTTYTATTSSIMTSNYQWVKNGVHVGSNSKYYTDTAANMDNVYCIVTARTCSGIFTTDTTNTIHAVVVPDGVTTTPTANAVKVYPNPAKEIVNIEVNNQTDYRITALQGAEKQRGVLCKGANTVSLQGLASGVYVLELVLKNETKIVKIVKE
jgi:hypothetical protein